MNKGAVPQMNLVSIKGIDKMTIALTEGLMMCYEKAGRPPFDLNSPAFWAMLHQVITVWQKVFPWEVEQFNKDNQEYIKDERSINASLKGGLIRQFALPPNLYRMIKAFWKETQLTDKRFAKKFTDRYPFFKTTKHNL